MDKVLMDKVLMNKAVVIATWVVAWVTLLVVASGAWEDGQSVVVGVTMLAVGLSMTVITALKGKWWLFWLGFLPLSPTHMFGAVRLAMPGSWWYQNRYDDEKKQRADERHASKLNVVFEGR
jgi:hypothetical protein